MKVKDIFNWYIVYPFLRLCEFIHNWIKENPKRVGASVFALLLWVGVNYLGLQVPQFAFDVIGNFLDVKLESDIVTSNVLIVLGWLYAILKWGNMKKSERRDIQEIPEVKTDIEELKNKLRELYPDFK